MRMRGCQVFFLGDAAFVARTPGGSFVRRTRPADWREYICDGPFFMSDLQTTSQTAVVAPDARAPARRRTSVALHTCLVVSTSARRAQIWVRAAHEEQWATIVCATADDAIRQAVRQRVDLALI